MRQTGKWALWAVGALLVVLVLGAWETTDHKATICTDCYVIHESTSVFGITLSYTDRPTPLTEMLNRWGEDPSHAHHFLLLSERTGGFAGEIADGIGGELITPLYDRNLIVYLENLYRFEDRALARRWKDGLLSMESMGKGNYDRFRTYMQKLPDLDIPDDQVGWRKWWKSNGVALEQAVFESK